MISSLLMRPMRSASVVRQSISAVILLGLWILSGCESHTSVSTSDNVAPPVTLQSIQVSPTNPSVAAGTSVQLAATAIYSDNSHTDVTTQVAWSSSVATIATVGAATGDAAGLAPGSSTMSASYQGQSASIKLTVTAATLVAIDVSPATPRLAAGSTQAFTATGTFSNHTTQNLTADVHWSLSDTAVATIISSGTATGVGVGKTTITATCAVAGICGSVAGSATLTVTAAALVSIAVTAPTLSVPLGATRQFMATGTYADHSTQNLTSQVTWASGTASVATLSNATGSAGLASSVAAGTTSVTASLGAVSSAPVTFTVSAASLVGIAITPATPSIALGTVLQLTATGTYTDSTTQILTSQVTWASSLGSVATVSNASGSAGLATSVVTGTTSVTAGLGAVTSGSVTLTVTAATLVSIANTPANPSVTLGGTIQFTATGSYTDSSTQDLTAQVMWESDTPSVATISNVSGTQGLATALAVGTTNISTILGGISSAAVALAVEPPSFTIPGAYTWIVPANVSSIQVVATAGGGGDGIFWGTVDGATGGNGGVVTATLVVNPGDTLTLFVGGGGATGGNGGGGGGGSTTVNAGSANQIIAGGGGGGGMGNGGDGNGGNGSDHSQSGVGGGTGGSNGTGGGNGGSGNGGSGGNGAGGGGIGTGGLGLGGGSGALGVALGGGGGGGYGGGGGNPFGGGGGGSTGPSGSTITLATNGGNASAPSGGNGSIVITIGN